MIISENKKPSITEFEKLCINAESLLNKEAHNNPVYFKSQNGQKLEPVVLDALKEVSKGTVFDNSLKLIGGQKFPDIIAAKYYGVEVKSTKDNQWTVVGGSVVEGTRIESVENIFLMFGKLADPVLFKTRRYQDCLYDIAVTHSPRYKINMMLPQGQTIFDKMGVTYDQLRRDENPIHYVVDYYRDNLAEGESLWWVNGEKTEEKTVPVKIRLWNTLNEYEKHDLIIQAIALFPELFSNRQTKYSQLALWLVREYGVISTSLRDSFSAGGQVRIIVDGKHITNVPRIFERVINNAFKISSLIKNTDPVLLRIMWGEDNYNSDISNIDNWLNVVAKFTNANQAMLLKSIFNGSCNVVMPDGVNTYEYNSSIVKEYSFNELYGRR